MVCVTSENFAQKSIWLITSYFYLVVQNVRRWKNSTICAKILVPKKAPLTLNMKSIQYFILRNQSISLFEQCGNALLVVDVVNGLGQQRTDRQLRDLTSSLIDNGRLNEWLLGRTRTMRRFDEEVQWESEEERNDRSVQLLEDMWSAFVIDQILIKWLRWCKCSRREELQRGSAMGCEWF